jgi:hypothetical protein
MAESQEHLDNFWNSSVFYIQMLVSSECITKVLIAVPIVPLS